MAALISIGILALLALWGGGCHWACSSREERLRASEPALKEQTSSDKDPPQHDGTVSKEQPT